MFSFPALDTTDVQIKKQVFELLSALCVYSAEGYKRALEALEHYKTFRSERYRFKLIVEELKQAKSTDYQTVLLAFVNCLIISTPQLKVKYKLSFFIFYWAAYLVAGGGTGIFINDVVTYLPPFFLFFSQINTFILKRVILNFSVHKFLRF